jgi:alcohol dehydrogenase (cytochrome c)
MTVRRFFFAVASLILAPALLIGQDEGVLLNPVDIYKPLVDSWPVYSGDYTGQRFSALTQVNQSTVKNLTLAWTEELTAGAPGGGGFRFGGGPPAPVIVGGEGSGEFTTGNNANVKGSILMVNDVLYVTSPDNVWAMDARDGSLLWRYFWKTRGGTHIGNRGAALWNNYLFFETPDNYLVSLDARTGEERWHVEIADFEHQ